jgi:hypothetical protein
MEGRDSYRILVLFSYSYYKYGHNWAPKYERLLESGMVKSYTIFQLHIFKRQIYANILDASAFPTPRTTGPLTRTKTMFYRLKAIDANRKPTTNLQFRRKLVEEISADRMAVQGSKKQGYPFSDDGAERLGGKQHFIYANETAIPKTAVCSNSKMKGGRRETVYYCATRSSKPGLNPGEGELQVPKLRNAFIEVIYQG